MSVHARVVILISLVSG
ncbi:hypothetical protein MXB_3360 [Myxobolus squamalis]|nr:hypothetical protein MXB_3360 [Myxobolus squamalis]